MMKTLAQAASQIQSGSTLMVAGDLDLLKKLPKGQWIGGTIPYFIAEKGGTFTKSEVFVTELDPKTFLEPRVFSYPQAQLASITSDAPDNGVTLLILPFGSDVLLEYAKNAPEYPEMFQKPLIGWISGVALADLGTVKAAVVDGTTGEVYYDRAMALHARLPAGRSAKIGIVNIFEEGSGDKIEFFEESFDVRDALVNGKRVNFHDYVVEQKVNTQLPLVGNFSGALINVSIMSLDAQEKVVHLYAPVFKNMDYHFAKSVGNYSQAFARALSDLDSKSVVFSCNCILNYLYGELEGKTTGSATGPVTFGEIAFQLVNQTFVYLEV
jgi:hypothetical protein